METRYELLSYGIPVDALPFDFNGNWRTEYHHRWLELQQAAEQQRQQQGKLQVGMGPYFSVSPDDTTDMVIAMAPAAPSNSSSTVWGAGGGDIFFQNPNGSFYVPSNISGGNGDNKDVAPPPTVTTTTSISQASRLLSSTLSEATSARVSSNSSSADGGVIFHLEPMDVLLGSGHTIDDRPGNVRFRRLLSEHLEQYDRASKLQKTAIAQHLVKYLKETQNVRFLQRRLVNNTDGSSTVNVGGGSGDSGVGWVEVDEKTVREKISRTFRRLRQNTKK
jgi:hypothetical protein